MLSTGLHFASESTQSPFCTPIRGSVSAPIDSCAESAGRGAKSADGDPN